MVFSWEARDDVDNNLLTKRIIYRRYGSSVVDAATDETSNNEYEDYVIQAQCTLQTLDSKYVSDGVLIEGDLVGLFRFRYKNDADGFIILPELTPRSKDKIKFLGQWFSIKQCTPAIGEDSGIIAWDFTAGQSGLDEFEVDCDKC